MGTNVTGTTGGHMTAVLGAEHDWQLRSAVLQILQDLGATEIDKAWAVAGSQELTRFEVMVGDEIIIVEGETYIGVSITGAPHLVSEITTRLRDRLPHGSLPR
jgi:hypothetical protein